MGIFEKLSTFISRFTGPVLVLVAILFALAAVQIVDPMTGQLKLVIDPSANRLISEDEPAKIFYD
ncbi:MAG: hypothetical protein HKM88_06120 [Halobacteria archaeon]|nr:hypothetical protein [Halobacteria archaeon]